MNSWAGITVRNRLRAASNRRRIPDIVSLRLTVSSMRHPALLMFDLGGVLIESSVFANLNRLLPEPLDDAAIKQRWLHSAAVRRFELGEISAEEFAERFIAEWRLEWSATAFLTEFAAWPRAFFPGARETLRELRKNHRLACLSNSNVLHCERFRDYEQDFDVALFSHRLGVIKPDPEAFELALSKCGVEADQTYFFDDCAANIDTAQRLGIKGFQVAGFESLSRVLRQQGLYPN